jgi:hypothetical protein
MTKILIFKDSVLETQKTEELRQSLIESIPRLEPGNNTTRKYLFQLTYYFSIYI